MPVTVTVSGFSDVTVRGTYELTLTITDTPPQTEPAGTCRRRGPDGPRGAGDMSIPERMSIMNTDRNG